MFVLALLAALAGACALRAETPPGLAALTDDRVFEFAERNWERLGVSDREIRFLERVYNGDGVEAFHIAYKSSSFHVTGYLARPYVKFDKVTGKPETTYPAVILNHGSDQGFSPPYREVALALARRGYVVAGSTYRGQRGREGRSQGLKQYARDEVIDVLQLTELVRKQEWVDSLRMAVIGQGHGASITAQAIGRSNVFRAAVLISPMLFSGSPVYRYAGIRELAAMSNELFGRSLSERELMRELSYRDTFRFADRIRAPMLIISPELAPGRDALDLWLTLLREKGVEHRTLPYPGMFADFLFAVDDGTRPPDWPRMRSHGWASIFEWVEAYVPPNPPEGPPEP